MSLTEDWIAALRSGEYKQGKRFLYNTEDDSYCCLGVLCDVMGKQKSSNGFVFENNSEYYTLLPDEVLGQVKFSYTEQTKLVYMNDTGVNFEKIANHLEKHYADESESTN